MLKYELEPYYITDGNGVGICLKGYKSWLAINLTLPCDAGYQIFTGELDKYNDYYPIKLNKLAYSLYINDIIKSKSYYWDRFLAEEGLIR